MQRKPKLGNHETDLMCRPIHIDATLVEGGALTRPLGRRLMTVSSSRSMPFVASICLRACAFWSLSSLILMILSSLVIVLFGRCRGCATASKTSGVSGSSASFTSEPRGDSPVSALRASAGLPSSTLVSPLRELRGERSVLMDDNLFSFLSIPSARAALPSSHAVMSSFRSTPMDSYCEIRLGPISERSFESSSARSDSSLSKCSLACKPRIPVDSEFSFRTCERQRSLPGVKGP